MTNGYPSGTTERDRRERQEFDGIRAFAPLGDDDLAWVALREAAKKLTETTLKQSLEQKHELHNRTTPADAGLVRTTEQS